MASKREQFRPVVGDPNYVVGDKGTVIRVRTLTGKPKWGVLCPCADSGRPANRHVYVRLCCFGQVTKRYVSQLVAEAHIGPCPEGHVVVHRNFDPSDNRASNLTYLKQDENQCRYLASAKFKDSQEAQGRNGWYTPKAEWAA